MIIGKLDKDGIKEFFADFIYGGSTNFWHPVLYLYFKGRVEQEGEGVRLLLPFGEIRGPHSLRVPGAVHAGVVLVADREQDVRIPHDLPRQRRRDAAYLHRRKLMSVERRLFMWFKSTELQGDQSGCFLGFVDIKTWVVVQYMLLIGIESPCSLKQNSYLFWCHQDLGNNVMGYPVC